MHITKRWTALAATVLTGFVLATGAISSAVARDSARVRSSSTRAHAAKQATGSPIVFGLINDNIGAVTFPEVQEAELAAADYVNSNLDGINGHPIKIDTCSSDGTPATSARCANELLGDHPVAILGGADTGAAGAFPVWERKGLAYLGGAPFTPVESNAPNARIFISVVVADNAAAVQYIKKQGVKTASIVATDNTQGLYTASIIQNAMVHAGITVKIYPVAPDAADFSTVAALATASHPDLVYDETPNACAGVLKALTEVGYTGKIAGIDTCSAPPTIAAAGSSINGMIFAQAFQSVNSGTPEAKVTAAALAKYAPKTIALDTPALGGFGTVMDVQALFSKLKAPYSEKEILAAVDAPGEHPNWLAHPYDCAKRVVPSQSAVCDPYELIKVIKSGQVKTLSSYLTGVSLYKPTKP